MGAAVKRATMVAFYAAGFLLVFLTAIITGALTGYATSDAHRWPYDVMQRKLLTPHVEPLGELAMQRVIDYHEEDCWRQYDRRIVSRVADGERPGMVFRPAPVIEQRLPVDLSGKAQTWSTTLPNDFPCGPAYLVETVTAACTWLQRHVRMLRKPDIITPFEVVGCPPPG